MTNYTLIYKNQAIKTFSNKKDGINFLTNFVLGQQNVVKEDECVYLINNESIYLTKLETIEQGENKVVVISDDANGPEFHGFKDTDSAINYIFNEITQFHRNPNDEWTSWIEENHNGLWFHWGDKEGEFEYTEYNTLFDASKYPDAPKTILALLKWVSQGKPLTMGWADGGSCTVTLCVTN